MKSIRAYLDLIERIEAIKPQTIVSKDGVKPPGQDAPQPQHIAKGTRVRNKKNPNVYGYVSGFNGNLHLVQWYNLDTDAPVGSPKEEDISNLIR